MPDIHIKRNHKYTRDDVRNRVQKATEQLKSQYPIKTEWKGQDQLNFSATGVKGTIDIRDAELEVKVEIGLLARPLKGRIEDGINKALDRELA